ncbi:MAG: serine hydrolase domain-containing protein, partial [Patescibacteria group bacterium]
MNEQIQKRLVEAKESHIFPGAVVGWVKRDGTRGVVSCGRFTYDQDAVPIQSDSIFDVASLTKAIPTGSLALQLIEEGMLSLQDQVVKYIPEFNNSYCEQVLVKHLLTYSMLLDLKRPLSSYKDLLPEELLNVIMTTDLAYIPGTKFHYSNTPALLLGIILERITGKTLDVLADERFFLSLGMSRTTFHPNKFSKEEIVPTEIDD